MINSGNSTKSLVQTTTISRPDRGMWAETAARRPTALRYTYSLGLFDLVQWKAIQLGGADPAEAVRGSPWFQFPTPPQTYDIVEPAATTIVPTQGGGKFVESQGSIIKDLRLTGTVGLRPSPVMAEILPGLAEATGVELTVPSSLQTALWNDPYTGLHKKEITGFDDITFLRNLFRGYWDLKRDPEYARRTVMVWIYAKDSEIYIVEPMNFSTTKDRSSPLSYTYNIALRTLYRFDHTIERYKDPVKWWQAPGSILKGIEQASRDLSRAINQINAAVNFVVNLPFQVVGRITNAVSRVLGACTAIKNTFTDIGDGVPYRQLVNDLKQQGIQLRQLCAAQENSNALGIAPGSIGKNTYGLNNTTPVDPYFAMDPATAKLVFRNTAIRAATTIIKAANRLLSYDVLFEDHKQTLVEDYKAAYSKEGTQFSAGSLLHPMNISMPTAAYEAVVELGETVRALAKRLMGDESYWKMIVILNNLKAPYISLTASDGVLAYGSKILIPKRGMESDSQKTVMTAQNTDEASEAQSPILKKYGRDLRLSDGSSGTDFADLEKNQRGDLSTIEGIPNVYQSMMIKLATEQGELALHPTFGSAYPIGTKVSVYQLQDFALNVRRTFLQDPRIASIDALQTYSEGDIVRVKAKLTLQSADAQLPVEFTVRRA